MTIGVLIAVYNEARLISALLDALLKQSLLPDEIIIVDDGSTDETGNILNHYTQEHPRIKYFFHKNSGQAAARNKACKMSKVDICVFTDGDCLPERNWIEELVSPFSDEGVGASAGAYETMNKQSILARFVGLEIAWKYRKVECEIIAHGTYNLAVRKRVLMEIGGFDESFRTAEDWDLTYKISKKYKIIYVPTAVVGHFHPDKFLPYMKNQIDKAVDRIRFYVKHPDRIRGDNYTPKYVAFQVLGAAVFFPSLLLLFPVFYLSFLVPLSILALLLLSTMFPFLFLLQRDPMAAIYGILVQFCRCFAWFLGTAIGVVKLGLKK